MSITLTPPTDDRGTMLDLFLRNVDQVPDVGAMIDGDVRVTWGDYGRLTAAVALGLRELGVSRRDVVGLHQVNRHELAIADVAALRLGATPTSFYNTLAPEQLAHAAKDSAARVVIVDGDKLDTWLKIRDELPDLAHLVCLDRPDLPDAVLGWTDLVSRGGELLASQGATALDEVLGDITPDDLVTIIYTSGTTGPPKGVMLTHAGMRFTVAAGKRLVEEGVVRVGGRRHRGWIRPDGSVAVPPGQRGISYLPWAHLAERFISHYSSFQFATEVTSVRDLATLPALLPQARPFIFLAVPRVWEKFHAGIVASLTAESNERRRQLLMTALDVAERKGRALTEERRADTRTEIRYALFKRLVYPKIRQGLGLDDCLLGFSGAAPIAHRLLHTFTGLGLAISENYGMTESHTLISLTPPDKPRVGAVGLPIEGTEVTIAADGEILFRGPHMTPGYLNRPEATAEAIDEDGWFHTGDLGTFDEAGYLKIIGRKKELIITAAGKNLSPNNIEEAIKSASPLISQVCAIGDERKFVSALILLDPDSLTAWCQSESIAFESLEVTSQHPEVHKAVQLAVDSANQRLARVEQVKRFTIVPDDWTPASPEMTPTMKLRRAVIHERHKHVIDAMYDR